MDGDLAEGVSIDDSRVTFHPNLPWEYCNTDRPLFEAIEQGRFKNEQVMRDTQKIPSTFAEVKEIRGNVAFGSAGGVDFSRHNFKWKHERFSDFNVIDNMTVHSVGPFIDSDGVAHEPDLPIHRASSPTQGRGGGTGVAFRYTSNVSLKNSRVVGSGRDNSVGVPFHDYLWTLTVENSTVEHWDWGIDTGEHRLNWIRNCTLQQNGYDVAWLFDNAGPAVLDNTDLDSIYHKFEPLNQKASEVLTFSQGRGVRVDGRTSHVEESDPEYVPFPDEDSLNGVNNIESKIETVSDETNLVGLTNQEMLDEYDICISGSLLPGDATDEPFMDNGNLVAGTDRTPPTSVYLDGVNVDNIGAFETIDDPDAAGGSCLRCTGSDSPKENPASITFDCASGTYIIYGRIRPDAWNGDSVYYRIDGGTWQEAEKLKSPIGFEWHDASPNGGEPYEWELTEGTHTLEFACGNDGVLVDEIFVGSDQEVLGAYGMSQDGDTGSAPAVDSLSLSEVETKNFDAEFDASWDVSDVDGDLESVDIVLTQDSNNTTEDSAKLSVSGASASGTTRLVASGDDGTGNGFTVEATVKDGGGSAASATASATESEELPVLDELSLAEVKTDSSDAAFDASWAVSDVDGDLDTVDLVLIDESDGETESSTSLDISGQTASDTTRLVAAGDGGSGNSYTVEVVVTDSFENTDTGTASATAEIVNEYPPAVDGISLSEVETDNSDAEFDASWAVSDADGNLSSVEVVLTDTTYREMEDSITRDVSGDTASDTTRLIAAGDEGSGHSYSIEMTVTDAYGETDSATASAGESENTPAIDNLAASEVETDNADAEFDVSWDISDGDGDLTNLELLLTQDSDDTTEDSVTVTVSGSSASDSSRLVAANDDGSGNGYTVKAIVTDSFDNTDAAIQSVEEGEPDTQSPYVDHELSQINAEDFDTGGEGVAYHDTSDGNKGGAYRDTDVDIQEADDSSGAYNIGWIETGEWWEYTVEVPESGEYNLTARLAGKNDTSVDIAVDGTQIATVDVPDTQGWQEWTTVDGGRINLSAGTQTIRVTTNGSSFNINWFGFEKVGSQSAYVDHEISQINAEDFDTGGEGVAYHDTSDGNKGGAYRDTDVDIQEADDVSGDYNLAWIRAGEWWEYTVDVPSEGDYDLAARIAGKNATSLDVIVDGSEVATMEVPDTGDWQEWTTVDGGTVTLQAGRQTIRLEANGDDFNLNWFSLK
ncbi:carbohydrate-binding protein [Halovenus amylolytica]|uniref:carbohydrate-binding protein n=1 Tax=Halovenus amylolytica TaxID=2500550 RepID=UPI003F551845